MANSYFHWLEAYTYLRKYFKINYLPKKDVSVLELCHTVASCLVGWMCERKADTDSIMICHNSEQWGRFKIKASSKYPGGASFTLQYVSSLGLSLSSSPVSHSASLLLNLVIFFVNAYFSLTLCGSSFIGCILAWYKEHECEDWFCGEPTAPCSFRELRWEKLNQDLALLLVHHVSLGYACSLHFPSGIQSPVSALMGFKHLYHARLKLLKGDVPCMM